MAKSNPSRIEITVIVLNARRDEWRSRDAIVPKVCYTIDEELKSGSM